MSVEVNWQNSRSEHTVPFIDGKACHSLVDPLREAHKWAVQVSSQLRVPVRRVFILGGGAGYHVAALIEANAGSQFEIYVIEKEKVLADFLRDKFNDEFLSSPVHIFDERQINDGLLRDILARPLSTVALTFSGAVQAFPDFYFECRKLLLAQTQSSWDINVKSRSSAAIDHSIFERAHAGNRHPLQRLIHDQAEHDVVSAALVELFT